MFPRYNADLEEVQRSLGRRRQTERRRRIRRAAASLEGVASAV
jgi:hypothetical protein